MKHCMKYITFVILTLGLSANSWAVPITETTDAGVTTASAFVVPGGTTLINGTVGPATAFGSDVDLYQFAVATDGIFSIQANQIGPDLDMNLILFNALGQGLAGDDDNDSSGTPIVPLDALFSFDLDSLLTLNLTAGVYYVAVGSNDIAAFETLAGYQASGGGNFNDFIDNDDEILGSPTTGTLGLVGTQEGPLHLEGVGDYTLYFSSATAVVPEPTTMTLLALGVLAMAFRRRRGV